MSVRDAPQHAQRFLDETAGLLTDPSILPPPGNGSTNS